MLLLLFLKEKMRKKNEKKRRYDGMYNKRECHYWGRVCIYRHCPWEMLKKMVNCWKKWLLKNMVVEKRLLYQYEREYERESWSFKNITSILKLRSIVKQAPSIQFSSIALDNAYMYMCISYLMYLYLFIYIIGVYMYMYMFICLFMHLHMYICMPKYTDFIYKTRQRLYMI